MKNKVYILCSMLYVLNCPAQNTWNAMGNGISGWIYSGIDIASIATITYYKQEIYISGGFLSIRTGDTAYSMARWNGSKWDACGKGLREGWGGDSVGWGGGFAELNGNLYVAGGFSTAGGYASERDSTHKVSNIAYWDSTNWNRMCGYYSGANNTITGLGTYNGNMYLGGHFGNVGGPDSCHTYMDHPKLGIAKWDGTLFSSIGQMVASATTGYYAVQDFCTHNGMLICGGDFDGAYDTAGNGFYSPHVIGWNDTTWVPIGTGIDSGRVFAVASYKNKIYAGGNFTTTVAGGAKVNYLVSWDGTQWQAVGNGLNGWVYDMDVDTLNNLLYVAGDFTLSGSTVVNHIALWNGSTWQALGTGTDSTAYAVFVYNNDVYVGGKFMQAGGKTVNRIARWGLATVVGVEEVMRDADIEIYPNPAAKELQVQSSTFNVKEMRIYNVLGECVLIPPPLRGGREGLDVSALKSGIYFLKLFDGKSFVTKKFVKE